MGKAVVRQPIGRYETPGCYIPAYTLDSWRTEVAGISMHLQVLGNRHSGIEHLKK